MLHPENCRFYEGNCDPDDWAHANCGAETIIYIANSSNLKVGITRLSQVPTRWIDQGAYQALPIMQVQNRYQSGLVEVALKNYMHDKTNWRAMLKGDPEPIDLIAAREKIFNEAKTDLDKIIAKYDHHQIKQLNEEVTTITYPVEEYLTKITSFNLDKNELIGQNISTIAKTLNIDFPTTVTNTHQINWHLINLPKQRNNSVRLLIGILSKPKPSKLGAYDKFFLENILLHIPQFIFWKDINSAYMGCNENYTQLLGMQKPEQIIGKTDFQIGWQSDGHNAEFFRLRDNEVLEGKHIVNLQQILSTPSGNRITVLLNKAPLIDENNKIIGVLGVATDISDLKAKEQELIKARGQAEAANKAKTEFLANISHDLRTPLNAIVGITELLKLKQQSTTQYKYIDELTNSSTLMLDLINDLLEFTQFDLGIIKPKYAIFDATKIIKNIAQTVKLLAKENGTNISLQFEHEPILINSAVNYLQRIILNILANAVKFTKDGNITIHVSTHTESNKNILQISIEDTGIGIPHEKFNEIFSAFSRLTTAYEAKYPGLGIGLTIAKKLTEEMGGKIVVDSVINKGSTFILTFPYQQAQPLPQQLDMPTTADQKQYPLRILLIEDERASQFIMKEILTSIGCKVEIVSTANEALKIVGTKFHLVITDIGLPDMDGCELTRQIKQIPGLETLPIIALTAHVLPEDEKKCYQSGVNYVMHKPVRIEELKDVINKFIPEKN